MSFGIKCKLQKYGLRKIPSFSPISLFIINVWSPTSSTFISLVSLLFGFSIAKDVLLEQLLISEESHLIKGTYLILLITLFFLSFPFLVPVGRMGEVPTLLAKPYSMGSSDPVCTTPQEFSYTFSSLPLHRGWFYLPSFCELSNSEQH